MLDTMVPPFHDGHDAIEQFLILKIHLPLPTFFSLIVDFAHVGEAPGSILVHRLLHRDHFLYEVAVVLSLNEHRSHILFIIDSVFLFFQHKIYNL